MRMPDGYNKAITYLLAYLLTATPNRRTTRKETGSTSFHPQPKFIQRHKPCQATRGSTLLAADMIVYNWDLAHISKTWFKSHHNDAVLTIPGYNRWDRARCRGGGVAIYVKLSLLASVYIPYNDNSI